MPAVSNPKILIVDDNKDFCDNLKDIAELNGYQALVAYNGDEAVEVVKAEHPEVVLMDIRMPGMDGVATLRKIKDIAPKTQVFLVSGFSMEGVVGKAMREGAAGFLKKPLDYNKFFFLVEQSGPKRQN